MIDPFAFAAAIKATIDDAIDGNRLNVYAMPVADPELPAVIVTPGSPFVAYRRTFGSRGIAEVRFDLEVRVALGTDAVSATTTMYSLAGTGTNMSVFDAISTDATLGGVVATSTAEDFSRPVERQMPDGRPYLTATLPVVLIEPRS